MKLKRREKNGRLVRPSKAEREAARLQALHAERVVVLAQSHRRGNIDQRCESPLGRFVIARKLKPELYDAGEHFQTIVMTWRRLKGLPGVLSNGPGSPVSHDDDAIADRINSLARRMRDADAAMQNRDASAVRWLLFDCPPMDDATDPDLCRRIEWGLHDLAIHFGMIPHAIGKSA
jgi:hypothetical protein